MHFRSHRELLNAMLVVCFVHLAKAMYEYELNSEGHILEGYVYSDVTSDQRIQVGVAGRLTGEGGSHVVEYLQLTVTKKGSPSPLLELKNGTSFFVGMTDAVYVDANKYIVTNDTAVFDDQAEIVFYVVLIKSSNGDALSNPFPFIIRTRSRESTEPHYSNEAAIFAGVLILVIVFLALFIPFVVRAKRRMRAGKPVMKLGSHAGSEVALERKVSSEFLDLSKRSESVPNFYGENTSFDYGTEVKKEKDHFTKDIKHLDSDYKVHDRATFLIGDEVDGANAGATRPKKGILRAPKTQTGEEVSKL